LIVPFTSQLESQRFAATVRIEPSPENGLSLSSIAMVFQTRAVDRNRFVRRLGAITDDDLASILSDLARLTGQG
jgi:mRNA interferase MazF